MNAGNTLVLKRTFPASCERLFAMWTSAELMMKWFCPSKEMEVPVAEVDAREGGSYRIVMKNKDGETYSSHVSLEQDIAVRILDLSCLNCHVAPRAKPPSQCKADTTCNQSRTLL